MKTYDLESLIWYDPLDYSGEVFLMVSIYDSLRCFIMLENVHFLVCYEHQHQLLYVSFLG